MSANGIAQVGRETELRSMRRAAGLSQQRVAELACCSLATVVLYERGYQPRTSEVLPRIRAVLNDESPAVEPGSREITAGQGRPESG